MRLPDKHTVTITDAPIALQARERTPEGFLRATAALTSAGVQQYGSDELGLPGLDRRVEVYRPADTVFDAETKTSARMKPVTLGHPTDFVTPCNYRELAVGHLGDEPFAIDAHRLGASLTLTDAEAIAVVEGGQDQVSAGYTMNVLPATGTHEGQAYEYRVEGPMQINHVALVPKGRAGSNVRILDQEEKEVDEARIKQIITEALAAQNSEDATKPPDPAAIADAVAKAVAPAVTTAIKAADEARALAEQKAADEKQAKDKAEADMRRAADERAHLIVSCAPLLARDAKPHSMTDREILEAALGDSVPDASDRSDDYLKGVLAVTLQGRDEATARRATQSPDGMAHNSMQAHDKARASYEQYLQDAWKGKVS